MESKTRLFRISVLAVALGFGLAVLQGNRAAANNPSNDVPVQRSEVVTGVQTVSHQCCIVPVAPPIGVGVPDPVAAPAAVFPVYPAPVVTMPSPPVTWVPAAVPVLPRTPDVLPPPGTLGRTYLQPSRPIPWDKHPRTAMLEITIDEKTREILDRQYPNDELKVTVSDIKNFFEPLKGYLGTDGIWHFESTPVFPGIPHIYDAQFEVIHKTRKTEIKYGRRIDYDVETKVDDLGFRRLRLIPGRIVGLRF